MESVQSEFYSVYEKSSDWLRLLARSEIRIKLLMILNEENMKLGQLRDYLNLTSSTILHAMKDMEDEELLENTDEGYALTNIGKIQALMISDLIKTITVLTKNKDFWLTHDISGIPDYLLKRLGDLGGCDAVSGSKTDILKPHLNFIKILMEAKEVRGVSPIFYQEYPTIIEKLVENNANVETIVTNEVLSILKNEGYKSRLDDIINEKNFRLWVIDEEVKVAFTFTDSVLSLGLFRDDGTYDLTTDLIFDRKDAIEWSSELFEFYRNRSKRVKSEDI
ncbi:MAG: winged helix-turn-helix domain-containing protein [Halobacteriota archaeon]|nr:winged helix-turn-helix domain-containing protein [Halobacteriota archaeon]